MREKKYRAASSYRRFIRRPLERCWPDALSTVAVHNNTYTHFLWLRQKLGALALGHTKDRLGQHCSPEPYGRRDVERREQFRVGTLKQHRDCFFFSPRAHRAIVSTVCRPAVHCRRSALSPPAPRPVPRAPHRGAPRPVTSRQLGFFARSVSPSLSSRLL